MKIDEINADIWIEDLLAAFPKSQSWLRKQGIVCIQCGEPVWGSLGEQAEKKGLDKEQIAAGLKKHLKEEK